MKAFKILLLLCSVSVFAQSNSLELSLDEAKKLLLENNYNKKKADLSVKKADLQIKETIGQGLPQINGFGTYNNYIKQPVSLLPAEIVGGTPGTQVPVTFGTEQNLSFGATINQLIFDGTFLVGLQSAKAYKNTTQLSVKKVEEELLENLEYLYSSYVISDEYLDILNKNLKVVNKNLHDVTMINKEGLNEEQDVDQMTYNKNVIEKALTNLENQRLIILENIKYLLELDPNENLNLTTKFDYWVENALDIDSQFNANSNIDIQLADSNITNNELLVKYEKSKYLPSLSAFLNSSYNGYSDNYNFFNEKFFNTTFWGLSLNVPIFSGFQRKYKIAQTRLDLEVATLDRQNKEFELNRDFKVKNYEYQNFINQLDLSKQQLALSMKIYQKEEIKFYEGIGNSADLTKAEEQKYSAQNDYIQAMSDVINKKIELDKITGKILNNIP